MRFAKQGVTLRSGGAIGADLAFEYGCGIYQGKKEIYFPHHATTEAMEMAAKFHPVWDRLSPYVRSLHARNAFQVLGLDLQTPSTCLICWTQDGCTSHAARSVKTGGTGTTISIASSHQIPVYNLVIPSHLETWKSWLNKS